MTVQLAAVASQSGLGGSQRVQPPLAGNASQLPHAPVLKTKVRPDDQVLDGAGDEHLAGLRARADAGTDMNRHSGEVPRPDLAFARMDPGADVDAQRPHPVGDRGCALYRTRRSIEGSEEPASITVRRSSIPCSSVGGCPRRSDRPCSRLSQAITRANDASRSKNRLTGAASQMISRCETKPPTNARSGGPLPSTAYAMLTSPLRA